MRKLVLNSVLLALCLIGTSATAGDLVPINGSFGTTGSATFEATADLQSATAQISFEGEVSTVGSLK